MTYDKTRFKKNNHYCVVHTTPKLVTDKTFFLFIGGRFFSNEEMKTYIEFICGNQPYMNLKPTKIEYRVTPERILELEKDDPEIDWVTCSRGMFKHFKKLGEDQKWFK